MADEEKITDDVEIEKEKDFFVVRGGGIKPVRTMSKSEARRIANARKRLQKRKVERILVLKTKRGKELFFTSP